MKWLIAGLGNPPLYKNTRHSVGQLFLSYINMSFSHTYGISGYHSLLPNINTNVILFHPYTYMNICGKPISAALRKFSTPATNLILIHDDIDNSLGKFKVKNGGSASGHHGVESVIGAVGMKEFKRIKIGVGRPMDKLDVPEYLLSPFRRGEVMVLVEEVFPRIKEMIEII